MRIESYFQFVLPKHINEVLEIKKMHASFVSNHQGISLFDLSEQFGI